MIQFSNLKLKLSECYRIHLESFVC